MTRRPRNSSRRPTSRGACGSRRRRGVSAARGRHQLPSRAARARLPRTDAPHRRRGARAEDADGRSLGEAQEALRPDATPEERRRSLETIERGLRGPRAGGRQPARTSRAATRPLRSAHRAELDLAARRGGGGRHRAALGSAPRGVRCVFRRNGRGAGCAAIGRPCCGSPSNLVSNAVLYTAPGTMVEVRSPRRRRRRASRWKCADRGPGIAPEERAPHLRALRAARRRRARSKPGGLGPGARDRRAGRAGRTRATNRWWMSGREAARVPGGAAGDVNAIAGFPLTCHPEERSDEGPLSSRAVRSRLVRR